MHKRLVALGLTVTAAPLMVAPALAAELNVTQIFNRKVTIHSCLLKIYLTQRKPAQVKEEYDAILSLTPTDGKFRSDYGTYLAASREYQAAAVQFKKALSLDPTNYEYNGKLGIVLLKQKDMPGALKYLKKAVEYGGKEYLGTYQEVAKYLDAKQKIEGQRNIQKKIQPSPKPSVPDDDDW